MIRVTARMPDGRWQTGLDPDSISDLVDKQESLVWVQIQDPDESAFRLLREEFNFHPLAIEDVVVGHERPKVDVYDRYYFVVLYCVTYDLEAETAHTNELEMFIGSNYVVTVSDDAIQEVEATLAQWQRNVEALGTDIGALVYTLLDRIVDDYFPVIDAIADRAEDIEQRIFEKFDVSALEDILQLKKELVRLRRLVTPARDVVNVFLRRDPPIMPRQSLPYFQDVYDHIIRVTDSLDTYQELLSSTLDAFLSVQSNRLNEIIYRLTLVSVIFLPLTFLTGFFGMNFEAIHFESGGLLVLALVLMVVTPLTFYRVLARRAWDA